MFDYEYSYHEYLKWCNIFHAKRYFPIEPRLSIFPWSGGHSLDVVLSNWEINIYVVEKSRSACFERTLIAIYVANQLVIVQHDTGDCIGVGFTMWLNW